MDTDSDDYDRGAATPGVAGVAGDGRGAAAATGDSSDEDSGAELDCYPYTFSPLLLFAESSYFDKGYSNYNSVAQFFAPVLKGVDMLENVIFERKNMLYEDLVKHVQEKKPLITCCIEEHFTALQVLSSGSGIYYNPLSPHVGYVSGESFLKLVAFLLLKCNYGDSVHVTDNKDHYTGAESNPLRRMIYGLWRDISKLEVGNLYSVRFNNLPLNLKQHVLINGPVNHRNMSTQLTGNTCYFQTFLFGVLCKVGVPSLGADKASIDLAHVDALVEATAGMSRFLLEFFVQQGACKGGGGDDSGATVLRPLTNSNVVLDFYRHRDAPYFGAMTNYLRRSLGRPVPDYELQYTKLLAYFEQTKTLHG